MNACIASVVIPAHNEELTIARLLARLTSDAADGELDVVVVCNGCSDRTAAVAATFGSAVRVLEIAEPSKAEALRAGDQVTSVFPRIYVDADVELGVADVRALVRPLTSGTTLASAPERDLSRAGVARLPRLYYDVWERLPQVRAGLFGRGVVAVSEVGHQRISRLPKVMSDDLAMSEAFACDERCIVRSATVLVHPARTLHDLLKRRERVARGNAEVEQQNLRGHDARTTLRGLLRLALTDRTVAAGLPVFLAITAIARWRVHRQTRSGAAVVWQRDESSRIAPPPTSVRD